MPRRDPHAVLGVPTDASPATIKAAWRRLAREHHPDVVGADPPAARAATRRMAEINAAYEDLRTDAGRKPRTGSAGAPDAATGATGSAGFAAGRGPGRDAGAAGSAGTYTRSESIGTAGRAPGGAPRPAPGRPVTARLDTTGTFQPRDTTTSPRPHPRSQGMGGRPRASAVDREPPRASDPTGPLRRSRVRRFRPPQRPPLADALECRIEFGKFHGHTLGEIAIFEPSYIDWVASTITRDPDLTAAARVIRDDLDARGVARVRRANRILAMPAD